MESESKSGGERECAGIPTEYPPGVGGAGCRDRGWRFLWRVLFAILMLVPLSEVAGDEPEPDPPDLKVRGYGLWGNRELRRTIELLDTEEDRRYFDAGFIEDAVFILNSRVQQDGYLRPTITARVILDDGSRERFSWEERLDTLLPRPLRVRSVRFQIDKGVLYYYDEVEFAHV